MADDKEPPKIVAVPLEDVRRAKGEARVALPRSKVASLRAFRRVRMDRILGVLGLLVTLLGIALMFYWEAPPVVEKKFKVEWPTTVHDLENWTPPMLAAPTPPVGGTLEQATPTSVVKTFNVPDLNVTEARIAISWRDEVGNIGAEGDHFSILIEGPQGTNISTQKNLGTYLWHNDTFTFALSGIPDISSWPGTTEEQVRKEIGDRSNRTGTGEWKITVRLHRANHDYTPDGSASSEVKQRDICQTGCQRDAGEDFTVRFSYTTYSVKYTKLF